MTWSMPRPVTQWVAALLGALAVGAFTMGIINAPERGGRLPGERVPGQAAGAGVAAIVAPEATPLSQERIEGPPPAPEKPAVKTDEAADQAAAAATNSTPAPLLNLPPATNTTAPQEPAPAPNPDDEPPH